MGIKMCKPIMQNGICINKKCEGCQKEFTKDLQMAGFHGLLITADKIERF